MFPQTFRRSSSPRGPFRALGAWCPQPGPTATRHPSESAYSKHTLRRQPPLTPPPTGIGVHLHPRRLPGAVLSEAMVPAGSYTSHPFAVINQAEEGRGGSLSAKPTTDCSSSLFLSLIVRDHTPSPRRPDANCISNNQLAGRRGAP